MKQTPLPDWMTTNQPQSLDEKFLLLEQKKHLLSATTPPGQYLRSLLREVKQKHQSADEEARKQQPLAFFKPSYEQMLILNIWMYGISFIAIYSANRIGKTTACIINFLLWIFPNCPEWQIFKPYIVDDPNKSNPNNGKKIQVFPRPDIHSIKLIHDTALRRPLSVPAPNPKLPHYHTRNRKFLQWLQKEIPQAFRSPYPRPPWNKGGSIWTGAPDQEHFKKIIMPLWLQYIPSLAVERAVESTREIDLKIPIYRPPNPNSPQSPPQNEREVERYTHWEWIGKSYESKDTKWSSGAVDAIVLTEGLLPDKWKEIKARFKDPSIGSHDFTPYEAANSGAATALAQKIFKGTEPVPLPHFVFTEFSVHSAPRHIISEDKYKNLVNSYQNDAEGPARLEGKFYTSSALVLSNLNRELHLLDWTIEELFARFPNANLYRGIDPGLDHPTACAWGALLPTNQWVIYRMFSERGLSISERAQKIVSLSNNKIGRKRFGPHKEDFYKIEYHPRPSSELITASVIDYHVFKKDENTGRDFSLNYKLAGLTVIPAVTTGPEERALLLDDLLKPNEFTPHILTGCPPGPRVYFLRRSPGILTAILKWEEMYWDRKRSGDDKGQPKDKVPEHGDDELDAVCYLTSSPFKWTRFQPRAIMRDDSEPEPHLAKAQHHSSVLQRLQKRLSNQNTSIDPQDEDNTQPPFSAGVLTPQKREVVIFGDQNLGQED